MMSLHLPKLFIFAERNSYLVKNELMRRLCILLIGFMFVQATLAQDFLSNAKQLTIDDGLSQSTINCIFQDSDGIIWFGTQSGLNQYDGKNIRTFTNNPLDSTSIANNWIFSISEDKQQRLWIGTRNGLSVLNKKTEKFSSFYHQPDNSFSIDDNAAYSVLVDKRGNVWVKTRSVLNKYVPAENKFYRYKHYTEYFSPSQSEINFPIMEDRNGKIWVGSKTGLDFFDPKTNSFNKFFHESGDTTSITHNHITALLEDSKGRIWVASENGLNLYREKTNNFEQLHFIGSALHSGSFNNISSITEDFQGNIWLGTQGGGLIRMQLQNDHHLHQMQASNYLLSRFFPKGHRNNVVYSLFQDRSRNLWIGTDVSGLLKVDLKPKKFQVHTNQSADGLVLASNTISAITEDSDGVLWIGGRGQGISVYDAKQKKTIHFGTKERGERKLPNDYVHVIYKDSKGRFWLGTRSGVAIYDTKKKVTRSLFDYFPHIFYSSFSNVRVNAIKEDKYGNVWVATNEGLHMFNLETLEVKSFFHDYVDKNTISHNNIYDLVEAPDGMLWIATFEGLNRLEPKTEAVERINEMGLMGKMGSSPVYSLVLDGEKTLWAGTANGLCKIDLANDWVQYYTTKNGLPNNEVFKLIKSRNNQIWGSTGRGLFCMDLNNSSLVSFDKDDGLENLEFNTGVGSVSESGTVYFGSVAGYVSFRPDKIIQNQIIPQVKITDVQIISKSDRKRAPVQGNTLELEYNYFDFTVNFAALDFTSPTKNQYRYRMLGLGNEWVDIGNRSFVSFSRLSAGTYKFQVQGSNNDNYWNRIGDELTVVVHPPWWRRPFAYLFYLIIGSMMVYAYILFRERRLRYSKIQLQQSVKVRTLQIEQQKEEIETQRDIAVQQREQIVQQNQELEQTVSQLKTTQKQLVESEKMASLGSLVAGVSHEINTPVGIGITASSSVLERTQEFVKLYAEKRVTNKDLEAFLKAVFQSSKLILSNLQRTGELIKSFKQISVDESTEQLREFLLKEYLMDVVRSLQPKFKNRNIEFFIDCPDNLSLTTYPGALAQIFTNLIINSLNHAFPNLDEGVIRVECLEKEDKVEVCYRDNGVGIPEHVRERIFDPFYTTDMQSGTGLGMHIVYNLITQKLHGSVICGCAEEKGACFQLVFPKQIQE